MPANDRQASFSGSFTGSSALIGRVAPSYPIMVPGDWQTRTRTKAAVRGTIPGHVMSFDNTPGEPNLYTDCRPIGSCSIQSCAPTPPLLHVSFGAETPKRAREGSVSDSMKGLQWRSKSKTMR